MSLQSTSTLENCEAYALDKAKKARVRKMAVQCSMVKGKKEAVC